MKNVSLDSFQAFLVEVFQTQTVAIYGYQIIMIDHVKSKLWLLNYSTLSPCFIIASFS